MKFEHLYIKKENKFLFFIFIAAAVNLFFSYHTPLNLLGYAPHDDTLFFNLAKSISEYTWLGNYENTTLIKGPIYPIFISLTDFTGLPYRILESSFIIFSSLYFLKSIEIFKFNYFQMFLIFLLLINFPFQYSAIDYRLLRDSIYSWSLLLFISEIFFLYKILYSPKYSKKNIDYLIHSVLLGFFLFIFTNIREEGIWVFPGILFILFSFLLVSIKKNKKKLFSKLTFIFLVGILCMYLFDSILKHLNYSFYAYDNIVEFKDSNYVSGYSSLYRIKKYDDPKIGLTHKEWNILFENIVSLKRIESYIKGHGYYNWIIMGCDAIRSQRYNEKINCDDEMTVGYQIFAIRDALYSSGLNSPKQVSEYMKLVNDEIDIACKNQVITCQKQIKNMLPPWNFSLEALMHSLKNTKKSFDVLINSAKPDISAYPSYGKHQDLYKMSNYLNSIYTDPINLDSSDKDYENFNTNFNAKNVNYYREKTLEGISGIVDHLQYDGQSKILDLSGWAFKNKPVDYILVFINNDLKCMTKPSYSRYDINKEYQNIGFNCQIRQNVIKNKPVNIDIFSSIDSEIYELEVIDSIKKRLVNKFNEECFLENNKDVEKNIEKIRSTNIDLKTYWYDNLSLENRPCTPLYQNLEFLDNGHLFSNTNSVVKKIIHVKEKISYFIYNYSIKYIIVFLPLLFYLLLKEKKYFEATVFMFFLILTISRLIIIGLLDYTGMAPISPIYLISGTFSYYILNVLIFVFIIRYIFIKFFNP